MPGQHESSPLRRWTRLMSVETDGFAGPQNSSICSRSGFPTVRQGWYLQNHRMVGVGKDLCGSPSPTPCRSRVTQSRLHSTASRRGWNISREGDSATSLGSLGQGSVTLSVKKFFLMFSWSFLCFSLCPLPLVLSLGTAETSLALSS